MMLVKNPHFKVIEIFINAKIKILIDRKSTHASNHQHPERDNHGKAFQVENRGRFGGRRSLPTQNKVKTEKKRGARIKGKGLKSDKSILIKIGILRDGGIVRDFENG